MDDIAAKSTAAKRMSAIPRFSTKLPQPRSAAAKPPSPPLNAPKNTGAVAQLKAGPKQRPQSVLYQSTQKSGARPASIYGLKNGGANSTTPAVQARPARLPAPRSIPTPTPRVTNHGSRSSSDDLDNQLTSPSARPLERGDQGHGYNLDSQDDSDASTPATSSNEATSPMKLPKRGPRPSLSDRTLDSLSRVPPSPATNKRQSSFFNPQSPMPSNTRPTSSHVSHTSLPKINYGPSKSSGIARPASPTKRSELASATLATANSTDTAASARKGGPAPTPLTKKRQTMFIRPVKPLAVSTPSKTAPTSHARSQTLTSQHPAHQPASEDTDSMTISSEVSREPISKSVVPPRRKAPTKHDVVEDVMESSRRVSNSSMALREQIAQAKAAHRAATAQRKVSPAPTSKTDGIDFEAIEDPFNQKPKDGKDNLRKRVDSARKDGRLNISMMKLKELPGEVLLMYSSKAMETCELSWSETVDLTKFIAADNELQDLPEGTFPDQSREEIAADPESAGSIFAGIEILDLHGNMFRSIPNGLRRLDRLTTLNLSRNNLDSSIFETISQITSLRSLDLSCNDLTRELPSSLSLLIKLEELDLHGNRLTSLPYSSSVWTQLKKLRILNLSTNRLASIPIDPIIALPSLAELYVRNNALTGAFFPLSTMSLPNLQVLDIANNSIASLSFLQFLALPSLIRLDVSANRMPVLPDISSWTSLTTLLAEGNGFDAMPAGITKLKGLRRCDFAGNSIRELDPELALMDKLDMLRVDGNPLRDRKFLTMGAEEIKQTLRKRLGE